MGEQKTTTKPVPRPQVKPPSPPKAEDKPLSPGVDWQKAEEHVKYMLAECKKYGGRYSYNPYFWIANVLQPLVDRYNGGSRTMHLYEQIMALKVEEKYLKVPYQGPQ